MALAARQTWSYDDLQHFPDDRMRREIMEGELVVSPAPETIHQEIAVHLLAIIYEWAKTHGGKVYTAPVDVVFSANDVVEPDIVFVAKAHLNKITKKNIQGAPDLAVEILSPSTRKVDETIKLRRYGEFGVGEYWIVDPDARLVRVYRQTQAGAFGKPLLLAAENGDILTSPLFAGLEIGLGSIFPEG